MKNLILTLALSIATSASAPAHAVQLSNINGWKAVSVKGDKALENIFKGSEQILLVADENTELAPIVRVRDLGVAPKNLGGQLKRWQTAIFKDMSESRIITSQRIIKRNGQIRYLAEFQTDVGTETMLNSIVLATVVRGKLHILIFEQRRDFFMQSLPMIKRLFAGVTFQAEK